MLWEIWGRHKVKFLWDGAALAASWLFVLWKDHWASRHWGKCWAAPHSSAFWELLVNHWFASATSRLIPGQCSSAFPGRLLLKPASTARLILVPMLFGGAVIVTLFALWAELVWRHVVGFSASDLLWTSAVLLSLFWWMQVLAWGLPLPKGRMLAMVIMGMFHFFVGACRAACVANALSGWQWPIFVCFAGVRCVGRVDRAETDATGKLGRPIPDFHALEPLALCAGADLA